MINYIIFIVLLTMSLPLQALTGKSIPTSSELQTKIEAGNRLAKSGNYVKAEAELNAVIAKDPGNARAYKLRGHIYYAKGEYLRALKDLDIVVKLAGDHPNALVDRAIVHSMLGNHGLALADVERALKLKPDSHFAQEVRKKVLELATEGAHAS